MKTSSPFSRSLLPMTALFGSLALIACNRADAAPESATTSRVDIAVTSDGFVPTQTRVKVGQPVTLVVTRKVARTCATDIVIKDFGIATPLPEGRPVEVTFTPTRPGTIHYACAMGMVGGDLVAE